MKILHLSDLHIGRRMGGNSLLEEQKDILQKILAVADQEQPDCVVIAGDVYDRSAPAETAVAVFDDFLCALAKRRLPTMVVSGNHDSADRIAFGGRIMQSGGVYLSPAYKGAEPPVKLSDAHGEVNFYLLPFIRPASMYAPFPEEEFSSYTDALRKAIEALHIDPQARNVLVAHQYVTNASGAETELAGSEEMSIGGLGNVEVEVFREFDYVALGHIHRRQSVAPNIHYCGTPLQYDVSEAGQQKSVTIAELGAKGELKLRYLPLTPMREVKHYRGLFHELEASKEIDPKDFLFLTLTDEDYVPDAVHHLRRIYPYLIKVDYDNSRTRSDISILSEQSTLDQSPVELFEQFFCLYDPKGMNDQQTEYIRRIIKEIWEESV